jgi:hypothetical protein
MSLPEYGLPEVVRVCEPCFVERRNGQIKREPIPIHVPGEEHMRVPLDPDVDEAVKISLVEDQLRQARLASTAAEEEAQLAAAIAASLKDTSQPLRSTTTKTSPQLTPRVVLYTEKEKEMVALFGKLVSQMLSMAKAEDANSSDIEVEGEMRGTAKDIMDLKGRLEAKVAKAERSPVFWEFLHTIDDAIMDFEELQVRREQLRLKEKYPAAPAEEKVTPIQFPPLPEIKSSPTQQQQNEKKREMVPEN